MKRGKKAKSILIITKVYLGCVDKKIDKTLRQKN